jgi:hypothetical protein
VSRRLLIATISILLITVQSYYQTSTVERVFAQSPSFVRQEIIDDSGDWLFWKGSSSASANKVPLNTHDGSVVEVDKANNSSECEIGANNDLPFPDIQSVSYVSDGKNLSATVWLNSQFKEPPLNYTIDTFQEELKITISDTNLNLTEYSDVNLARLLDPSIASTLEQNSTTLSGNQAERISYNNRTGQNELKIMKVWTTKEGKAYDITFSSEPTTYDHYLTIIEDMIKSFEIAPSLSSGANSIEKANSSASEGLLTYAGSGIRIDYPSEWKVEQTTNNEDATTSILFRSPYEDSKFAMPSWREITFTMALDIDSVHDAGTDYRVIYSRVPDDMWTGYWTRQVREISAYDKVRVTEENVNYTDFYSEQGNSPYILFSFDLNKVNSPQRYKAVFYVTDYFVKDHKFCTLVDTTNWVIIPPPEFDMSANPSSVVLRPGEEKNVQFQLKGNTDLQSESLLTADNDYGNNVQLHFYPNNKTSIPPSGSGSFSLVLKANNTAEPRSYTFPITANISFPTSITNRGGETFNNNRSVNIIESSNLTLTVLPPYSAPELLSNFTTAWITPLSGIWTFVAGIGTVVAPLLLYLYRKRKKNEEKEDK